MKVFPGDLVSTTAGAILDDWIGPCERLRFGEWEPGIVFGLFDAAADVYLVGQGRTHRTLIDHIRLDADRAEVRDHCAQWLARHLGNWQPWEIARAASGGCYGAYASISAQLGLVAERWEPYPSEAEVIARWCLAAGGRS